jgi:putative heme-binding domain-containing protein
MGTPSVYDGVVKTLFASALLLLCPAGQAADTGEHLFLTHCAPCHGNRGDGGIGASLAAPRLLHAPDDEALGTVIIAGIPGTGMPPTRLTAEEQRALVEYVRGLGRIERQPLPGDPTRGERIFREEAKCLDCHAVGAQGGRIGSDLSTVGARRNAVFLRQAVLDPKSALTDKFIVYQRYISFPGNFLQVRVVTSGGQHIIGARLDEDAFSIQIRDYNGKLHSFMKSELKELHKDWGETPMPSYRGVLNEAQLDDLVAYLASLRGEKGKE